MTFTVKIALQPFEVAFEAGSIAEAVAILQEPDNELSKLAALATGQGGEEETATTPEVEKPAARRGRKSKAAVEAVAPPPIPVPDTASPVPAPVDTTPNANGIPAFLDRNAAAPAAVAPPPPAPVAPPPVVPASPPVGVLAGKVVAELKRRGEGAADQGAGLVGWLAGAGLVVPGATFAEACDCVMFLSDEKLGPVATALGVA